MTWPQFVKAFVNAMGRRNVVVTHVESENITINFGVEIGMLPNGFQFRAKHEVGADVPVVERLNSHAVANQMQFCFGAIPQGNGKHAHKTPHRSIHAPAFKSLEHNLRVGMPSPMPGAKLGSDLLEIINLAVKHDDEPAGGGKHRLMTFGREVKNGKAPECEANPGCAVVESSGIIRAAMCQRHPHAV